jgi:tetratricopeptide (TPR) repeat protein
VFHYSTGLSQQARTQYSSGPVDYEERTLYSTWNVSFQQVRDQDPAAAELLRLIAYLDNQDLWYELFQASAGDAPAWEVNVLKSQARFNRAISTLHNYSLLEVSEGRYSLHTCVHDWTLEYLNHEFDWERCRIAIHCVAANVSWESEAEYWVRNRRVLPHARRFRHVRLKASIDWSGVEPRDLCYFAGLYQQNEMNAEAEDMYVRALRGYEKAWGAEHTSTLDTANNLGLLYKNQGKMVRAEDMYVRALRGYEKAVGKDHPRTQKIARNLQALHTYK